MCGRGEFEGCDEHEFNTCGSFLMVLIPGQLVNTQLGHWEEAGNKNKQESPHTLSLPFSLRVKMNLCPAILISLNLSHLALKLQRKYGTSYNYVVKLSMQRQAILFFMFFREAHHVTCSNLNTLIYIFRFFNSVWSSCCVDNFMLLKKKQQSSFSCQTVRPHI